MRFRYREGLDSSPADPMRSPHSGFFGGHSPQPLTIPAERGLTGDSDGLGSCASSGPRAQAHARKGTGREGIGPFQLSA